MKKHRKLLLLFMGMVILTGCYQPAPNPEPWHLPTIASNENESVPNAPTPFQAISRDPGEPILTPTPNSPKVLPTLRTETETYVVQPNDALGRIAERYGVSLNSLINLNQITNPNLLEIGQVLTIPAQSPQDVGPAMKIIPDSELIFGPASTGFDLEGFIQEKGGYLSSYTEIVDEKETSGAAVLDRISREYSVNPRLLLTVLEYKSGWVTQTNLDETTINFPMGIVDEGRKGLYHQLAWAANQLNHGYYFWKNDELSYFLLADGSLIIADPTINAGTAGVQYMSGLLFGRSAWDAAVSEEGILKTYRNFFGYPFDYAIDPLVSSDIEQPVFQLPFESWAVWSFTGGPHAGWGDGSAWAALDFAPPGGANGCNVSGDWVVAVADGPIIRSENGEVIQDLDGDGYEQTGWTVLYMHISSWQRVEAGTYLKAGDPVGHASCEGGVSTGAHVHLARRYNGEWILADGAVPFVMDGFTPISGGSEYDGELVNGDVIVTAWDRYVPQNQIQR